MEVARQLFGKSLQVVTNSIPIANLLLNQSQIELVQIGGYLYPKTGVALGPLAVSALKQIHVRRLVMSAGGITLEGLYNSNTLLVEAEQEMLESAEEVIVVSDSSKLGHTAIAHLCSLKRVNKLIVDSGITPEWRESLTQAGVEVLVADA